MLHGEVSDERTRLKMVSMRENELDCGKDGHVVVSLRTRNRTLEVMPRRVPLVVGWFSAWHELL
jgi:hypothetical protein